MQSMPVVLLTCIYIYMIYESHKRFPKVRKPADIPVAPLTNTTSFITRDVMASRPIREVRESLKAAVWLVRRMVVMVGWRGRCPC